MNGFVWAPEARLFDGVGLEYFRLESIGSTIAERPAGVAVAQAMAAGSFRIGGAGPGPSVGFETLTSGSSGAPRRIARSFASWTASFAVNRELFVIGPGVALAVLGRLTQSLALYGALEGLHLGASVHLLDDLRPDRQAGVLAARRVEVLYATPVQLRLLVEAGVVLPGLRLVLVGGAKLDLGLRAGLRRVAPSAEVREFYGAAEASFITLSDCYTPQDSVGRAYPGVEISVEAGEIWLRSPYVFQGYAGDDPGGAVWQDGWLSLGERGEMRDGWLYLHGRAGRMVTVADQNVFPEEIEVYLQGLDGVRRVAVLPVAEALRGSHLVAFVQGDVGREAAILAAVRARLGVLKSPKRLIWLQEWPELASGKTDLLALQREVGSWR